MAVNLFTCSNYEASLNTYIYIYTYVYADPSLSVDVHTHMRMCVPMRLRCRMLNALNALIHATPARTGTSSIATQKAKKVWPRSRYYAHYNLKSLSLSLSGGGRTEGRRAEGRRDGMTEGRRTDGQKGDGKRTEGRRADGPLDEPTEILGVDSEVK